MSTIVTRAGKGSPLTNNEIDSNFTNLNTDKLEDGDLSVTTNSVGTAALAYSSGVFTYTPPDLSGYAALSGATFTGEVEATGFNGDLTGAILFKGQAGEALTKGDPVYISGISGNTTIVSKADADDASKMPCFGLVDATVNANAACSVVTFGTLQGLDTSSFSEGDELFVSATGTLTTTAPTGESALLQKIAKVTKSHASSGSIKVSGAGRTNATPNLNDGNFFLGNGSNQAVSADFSTSVTNIALPLSGGALTGAVTTSSTFDGRDVATDGAKLDGIEAGADVTDTANVTAAGALMDSEVANLAQVKAFDSSDYATAAQGTLADNALPKSGGTMTGALVLNNTGSLKVAAGTTGQREGSPAAGMFRYNTTEGKFEGYTTEWGEIGGGAADLLLNSFTGDGSDVTFSLSGAAIENNTLVYIDGVYQNKATYAVSGNPAVVTFSEAPANGAAIEIMVAAIAVTEIGTPADNTVTTAKIVDNAVNIAKLAVTDGSTGQALITNGSGTLSFATVGGLYNDWLVKTANYTMLSGDQIVGNHATTAFTLTLPASPSAGDVVTVKNVGAALITLGRNGSNINSVAGDAQLPQNNAAQMVYVDSTIGWTTI